jgi:hypothetical protein
MYQRGAAQLRFHVDTIAHSVRKVMAATLINVMIENEVPGR